MSDPVSQFKGAIALTKGVGDFLKPDIPDIPSLPPPVEEVDVAGQKQYTKERLRKKKGAASTILASKSAGLKKTQLG